MLIAISNLPHFKMRFDFGLLLILMFRVGFFGILLIYCQDEGGHGIALVGAFCVRFFICWFLVSTGCVMRFDEEEDGGRKESLNGILVAYFLLVRFWSRAVW